MKSMEGFVKRKRKKIGGEEEEVGNKYKMTKRNTGRGGGYKGYVKKDYVGSKRVKEKDKRAERGIEGGGEKNEGKDEEKGGELEEGKRS